MMSIFQGSHKMLLVGFLPTHVSSFMSPKGALVLLNPLPGFETMHAIGIKYRMLACKQIQPMLIHFVVRDPKGYRSTKRTGRWAFWLHVTLPMIQIIVIP